jgi:hypothetical protein
VTAEEILTGSTLFAWQSADLQPHYPACDANEWNFPIGEAMESIGIKSLREQAGASIFDILMEFILMAKKFNTVLK